MTRLLERNADPTTKDKQRNTALHYAAIKGWTSIAKKLLKHHNVLIVTKDALTPLELAIYNNHNECATFLVRSMDPMRYRN